MNLLKVAKRLNKFTIDDLAVVLEASENEVFRLLEKFAKEGQVRKLNASEYLFIADGYKSREYQRTRKRKNKNSTKTENEENERLITPEEIKEQFYYFFRDYFLLYSAPHLGIAYQYAKTDLLNKYKRDVKMELPKATELFERIKKEFTPDKIKLYRKKSFEHKEIFERKIGYCPAATFSRKTITKVPEYLDICIDDKLNAFRILTAKHYQDFLESKRIVIEHNSDEYTFKLQDGNCGKIEFGDLALDTFIALIYLYKSKMKNKNKKGQNDFVFFSIDDIILLNSNKNLDKGVKIQRKSYYNSYVKLLPLITMSINGSEEKKLVQIEPVKIDEGHSEYYYNLKIDDSFIQDGKLNHKILRFGTYHDRREKFIGYYFNYLKSNYNQKKLTTTVENLMQNVGFDITPKVKPVLKDRLKKALNNLKEHSIIRDWRYLDFDKEVLHPREKFPYFISRTLEILF